MGKGHGARLDDEVAVLDGGYPAWVAEGRPVTTDVPAFPASHLDLADAWTNTIDRDGLIERLGDVVQSVAGLPVRGLADFYRSVWRHGAAGALVPLTIAREGKLHDFTVHSVDRSALLKKPQLQ